MPKICEWLRFLEISLIERIHNDKNNYRFSSSENFSLYFINLSSVSITHVYMCVAHDCGMWELGVLATWTPAPHSGDGDPCLPGDSGPRRGQTGRPKLNLSSPYCCSL